MSSFLSSMGIGGNKSNNNNNNNSNNNKLPARPPPPPNQQQQHHQQQQQNQNQNQNQQQSRSPTSPQSSTPYPHPSQSQSQPQSQHPQHPHSHPHPQQNDLNNAPFPNRNVSNGSSTTTTTTTTTTKGQAQNERLYLCLPFVKAALVKGNFKTIVALPKYVDVNEWVAVNLVDLFNNLNLFYSVVTEECTVENNPTMSAGPGMDYTWIDASRKRVKLPAPQYIDYVLTWVEGLIKDESVFPTKAGREFSPNFPSVARHIYTQLLRIFAHLYHAHYPIFLHLSSEGHLNSLFAHFLTFGREFDLLEEKETRAPKEGWPFVVGDLMDSWKGLGVLEA